MPSKRLEYKKSMPDLPALFDLHGRVAVVTGGAGLLGTQFCDTLGAAGAQVVVADINLEAAETLAASLIARWPAPSGPRALAVQMDVTSPESVRRMVSTTVDRFGRLDILVNNAALDPKVDPTSAGIGEEAPQGIHPGASEPLSPSFVPFEDFPLELWDRALAVNLTGLFLCCQAAIVPMLAQGKGVIVNLCSIYGMVGPDQRIYQRAGEPSQYKPVYYSVTKAGVLGLTHYLATYYAGKNLRVNALTPGGVYHQQGEDFVKAYSSRTLLGRMAGKDEMNGALLFLVSDASNYMTGANLVVDGGWTAW
ncbi:MAG TPA: SDR family oxidoreductase [Anaerolineales bacterium]|nr:SDR family oxidoreductase [Anaerolineales bacterium]